MTEQVKFNSNGLTLSALMDFPKPSLTTPKPLAYALFAHCFTCSKDIAAASHIAKALTKQGIAVMRFDFTGLGHSEGEFSDTNFSSNVQDLISASAFLKDNYQAPSLLIGHSLGGAAVLAMADKVEEVMAIATIGSPASAEHVVYNFALSVDDIRANGFAPVKLGPRTLNIQKQFLDDLESYGSTNYKHLNKALLIMHSPIDEVVNITEAEKIYHGAMHPKSFVSLNNADHLMSKPGDSLYAANVIAMWASQYIGSVDAEEPKNKVSLSQAEVYVSEKDHKLL